LRRRSTAGGAIGGFRSGSMAQSLCCHRFVAAFMVAFAESGSTDLLQLKQTNETPTITLLSQAF
jgi:hypothetical protein